MKLNTFTAISTTIILIICHIFSAHAQLQSQKNYTNDSLIVDIISEYPVPCHCKTTIKPEYVTKVRAQQLVDIKAHGTTSSFIAIPQRLIADTSSIDFYQYLTLTCRIGPSNYTHDQNHIYLLPYPKGTSYRVTQTYHGKGTHKGYAHSTYAIDFKLPMRSTITAARGGIVAVVTQHHTKAGGKELIDKANQIIIMHNDGTLGTYIHIDTNSSTVKVGDHVKAGQVIAKSGHNGYSHKPHLHFVVMTPDNTSVPTKFKGYKNLKQLKQGKYYKRK